MYTYLEEADCIPVVVEHTLAGGIQVVEEERTVVWDNPVDIPVSKAAEDKAEPLVAVGNQGIH